MDFFQSRICLLQLKNSHRKLKITVFPSNDWPQTILLWTVLCWRQILLLRVFSTAFTGLKGRLQMQWIGGNVCRLTTHKHTGWITNHLTHLHNKAIALLDTLDEIWVRFCTSPADVSWQLLVHLHDSHTSRYQSSILMEWSLLLQGSGTICSVLSHRNPDPRSLGAFIYMSLQ